MEHKLLFEPGLWDVRGVLSHADHSVVEVEGQYAVSHEPGRWVLKAELRPKADKEPSLTRLLEVAPFAQYSDTSTWLSADPVLGRLGGQVTVVLDTLLFDMGGEGIRGVEFMAMRNENQYTVRGCLFREGRKLYTWAVELTRA